MRTERTPVIMVISPAIIVFVKPNAMPATQNKSATTASQVFGNATSSVLYYTGHTKLSLYVPDATPATRDASVVDMVVSLNGHKNDLRFGGK